MTVKLNFDRNHQNKLFQLLDWLKGIGVVSSYEMEMPQPIMAGTEDGEEFLTKMLEQAEKDIVNGNVMTSEEVSTKIENWLKEHK